MKISRDKAIDLIRGSNGKIFNVTFIKRTTGEVRKMNARLGVSKYVTGEGLKFDPKKYTQIPVFEMPKKQYRMINLDGINQLVLEGEKYEVE